MPFTGSHPAAVVPLLRVGLVPSALVIGSVAPDLPYYVPLPVSSAITHSAAGIVGIDLLLGVAAFALWLLLLAPVVVGLAPVGLRDRLAPGLPVPPAQHVRGVRPATLVLASLVLGAATHVVWDAFTHADRWGTEHVGWLAATHGPLPGYRWAQYASGVLGAVVLVVAAARWWRRTPPTPGAQRIPALGPWTTACVAIVVGVALVAGAAAGMAAGLAGSGLRSAGFLAATWGGGAAGAAAVACAVACAPRLSGRASA